MTPVPRWLPLVSTPVLLLALALIWQGYVTYGGVSPFILPPPLTVLRALLHLLVLPSTWHHMAFTLYEAIAGFLIATVLGVALGVVLGKVAWLEAALQPLLVAMQVTPKVVLVPLFILWFGFGAGSKIVIAAVLAFLPIMSNTILGVKSIERGHRDVMASLSAGRLHRLLLLDLPSAMPYVLTGMEVGIILAMIGAIVGEFLSGTDGLGHLAVTELNAFAVDALFGVIVLLAAAGAALFLIVAGLRRVLLRWHASGSQTL